MFQELDILSCKMAQNMPFAGKKIKNPIFSEEGNLPKPQPFGASILTPSCWGCDGCPAFPSATGGNPDYK